MDINHLAQTEGNNEGEAEVEQKPYETTVPVKTYGRLKFNLALLNKKMARDGFPPMTIMPQNEPFDQWWLYVHMSLMMGKYKEYPLKFASQQEAEAAKVKLQQDYQAFKQAQAERQQEARRTGKPFMSSPPPPVPTAIPITEIKVQNVVITGMPQFSDQWEMIGSIDHIPTDDGTVENVVRVKPEFESMVPEKFYKSGAHCDHCNSNRNRLNTILLLDNENGSVRQIGRNCLVDYLGYSKDSSSRVRDALKAFDAMMGAESYTADGPSGMGGGRSNQIDAHEVIAYAKKIMDRFGWTSRAKAAESNRDATADRIAQALFWMPEKNSKSTFEQANGIDRPNDDDYSFATQAFDYASSLTDEDTAGSKYLMNLKALASGGPVISRKSIGLCGSIALAYKKSLETEAKKKLVGDQPYVGEIGRETTLTVQIERLKGPFSGNYGPSMLYFGTVEGKKVKWFGKPNEFFENETYTVSAMPQTQAVDKYEKIPYTTLIKVVKSNGAQSDAEVSDSAADPAASPAGAGAAGAGAATTGSGGGFIGELNAMGDFILTCIDSKGPYSGDFGAYYVVKFVDNAGNKAKAFAQREVAEIGKKYRVRAKPVKHIPNDKYDGMVTQLSRITKCEETTEDSIQAAPKKAPRARKNEVPQAAPQAAPQVQEQPATPEIQNDKPEVVASFLCALCPTAYNATKRLVAKTTTKWFRN